MPLIRFLGVPDPLEGGVGMAQAAGILEHVGGPTRKMLREISANADVGAPFRVVIPHGGNRSGIRVLVRARATRDGEVRIGRRLDPFVYNLKEEHRTSRRVPVIDPDRMVRLQVPASEVPTEVWAKAPDAMGLGPGTSVDLVLVADRAVSVEAAALVPLADELPPPAPEPWQPPPAPANDP